jgi:hypothetical protein
MYYYQLQENEIQKAHVKILIDNKPADSKYFVGTRGFLQAFMQITKLDSSTIPNIIETALNECNMNGCLKDITRVLKIEDNNIENILKRYMTRSENTIKKEEIKNAENVVFSLLACQFCMRIELINEGATKCISRKFGNSHGYVAEATIIRMLNRNRHYAVSCKGLDIQYSRASISTGPKRCLRVSDSSEGVESSLHSYGFYRCTGNLVPVFIDSFLSNCEVKNLLW